jgi:hypothetical protein
MEFGVWRGKTINTISKHLNNQTVYGFDSFEGLPESWFCSEQDIQSPDDMKHKKGFFAVENLPKVNENVKLIKGFFENSLPLWLQNNKIESIKILHIDSDLYSSAKTVLTLLNNYITKGTCIVFDEMCFFENPDKKIKYPLWREGEYKALKEWVEENNRKFEVVCRNKGMQCCIKIVE